ncbi:MAG TPA: patatin-like phospholipase family protein, partial [Thermodesulfobacteriota bacterium]|nr:patatin-like phospholipase family protein [Thermodesulfobacteriota bacterium]
MGNWFKIGVALGGGGARGLAHLGVLCALERERISFDLLTGTSMGALVGGMYAL